MKLRLIVLSPLLLALCAASPVLAGHHSTEVDGFRLEFDGNTLVLSGDHRHSHAVEITADFVLSVDGDRIRTDHRDAELLQAYYSRAGRIDETAARLGADGARLGAQGAAVGVRALGRLLGLLDDDYDTEDLEAEIKAETDKIELDAEGIAEAAEELEEMVAELEDIGDQLQERIPELKELDWF